MIPRVKICGMTRPQDVYAALNMGVDALGFVFYPPSKRCLDLQTASELGRLMPAFVSTVALFVNPMQNDVMSVIHALRPSMLQFHGDEPADLCRSFDIPYLKAFRVGAPGLDSPESLAQACMKYEDAGGWLFDSYTPAFGGSGQRFDLDMLASALVLVDQPRPIVISGGLDPKNVKSVIERIHPWAVDASSSVELSPGIKSTEKMQAFMDAVKSVECLS